MAFVGVAGNMMLWAAGHDIGEINKNFIRDNLGDEFDNTWNHASNLISKHRDLLFLPLDLAIEVEENRVPISLDDLPTDFPIYDIGIQTLMELKPKINNDYLWKSWTTLRAKSIYEDTLAMNISDINSMTYQAIWEFNKGKEIKSKDLVLALDQKQQCLNQINLIFKNFDFLALPSAQTFPFDKNFVCSGLYTKSYR